MILTTYHIEIPTAEFMAIFALIWHWITHTSFSLFGIPLTIWDITVGIWLGCIGMWVLRKIIYD